jgi:hypothetical protein
VLIVLREKYCCQVVGGWFVLREKYCWLVVDKPSEQTEKRDLDFGGDPGSREISRVDFGSETIATMLPGTAAGCPGRRVC